MNNPNNKKGDLKVINKSLKYSVVSKFINFNPDKYTQKIIIVDGKAAIQIKGRYYKMILAKR